MLGIVGGGIPRFLWVKRLSVKIGELEDGGISAWPAADYLGCWRPHENDEVRLASS